VPSLSELLAADSGADFYAALPNLDALDVASFAKIVLDSLTLLSTSIALSEREKAERVNAILSRRAVGDTNVATLLDHSPGFSSGVRNALARFVLPEQRLRLTSKERPVLVSPNPGQISRTPYEPSDRATPTPQVQSGVSDQSIRPAEAPYSTVLLLAKGSNQEGASNLIANYQTEPEKKFFPLHFESWERVENDLRHNADICGCVIDGSFLTDLNAENQADLFRTLGLYSTFMWLRVDFSELKLPVNSVREIIRTARCQLTPVRADGISFQPDGILRENELPDLERARTLLRTYLDTQLTPGGLRLEEGRLLRAAVREIEEENDFYRHLRLSVLEVEFLSGGKSGARTLLVKANDGLPGIIAKMGSRQQITDEIQRFFTFVQLWDRELQPRAFFHGDAAVILFGLLPDQTDPTRPAEMIERQLQQLWIDEFWCQDDGALNQLRLRVHNFGDGLEAVARKLLELNCRNPNTDQFIGYGIPDPMYFGNVEHRGISWGLSDEIKYARLTAKLVYDRLHGRAVVHGDLHLGNILLRAERDPHLIDYAASGPGHPAIDLVRFELSLFTGISKQLASEQKYVRFQKAFSLDFAPLADLKREFPDLFSCLTNEVCLRGCVAARDRALDAVRFHGGDVRDYLAAKYLTAWQCLILDGRQAGLCRSVIKALAPPILQWTD
jgi:Phosphotransferase enzyme family